MEQSQSKFASAELQLQNEIASLKRSVSDLNQRQIASLESSNARLGELQQVSLVHLVIHVSGLYFLIYFNFLSFPLVTSICEIKMSVSQVS